MALEIPFEVNTADVHTEQMLLDIVGLSTLLTDLNIGGVARTLVEAMAIQLEALDSKMFFGLQRAIPTSLYTAFNFPLIGPVKATGTATFIRSTGSSGAISIPVGTKVIAPATVSAALAVYSTLGDATLPVNKSSVDVGVSADIAGTIGNISAGRINTLQLGIPNIGSVYNYAAIKNGADTETQEQRAVRFRKFIQNLARSTLAGLEAGALMAQIIDLSGAIQEIVQRAIAIEPPNALARVDVYIDNGGGTASAELVAAAQRIIDGYKTNDGTRVPGYKAAGVVVTVSAIESVAVDVTAKIEISDGFVYSDVTIAVQDAIENYFLSLEAGGELILVDLIVVIAEVPGVRDVDVATPTANINASSSERLLAGAITLSEL